MKDFTVLRRYVICVCTSFRNYDMLEVLFTWLSGYIQFFTIAETRGTGNGYLFNVPCHPNLILDICPHNIKHEEYCISGRKCPKTEVCYKHLSLTQIFQRDEKVQTYYKARTYTCTALNTHIHMCSITYTCTHTHVQHYIHTHTHTCTHYALCCHIVAS